MALAYAAVGLFVFALFQGASGGRGGKLGRGLMWRRLPDGKVYLGWRLLADDAPRTGFYVFRRPQGASEEDWHQLTAAPILDSSNYLDELADPQQGYEYALQPCLGEVDGPVEAQTTVSAGVSKPYLSVPMDGDYQPIQAVVGDLDGDGEYELVIKQPFFNTDPYQHPGYWKRSEGTFKLEAYKLDGTMLWRHDLGWSIEQGVWYAPYTVFDLDGDGRAEVITKAGEGDPREPTGHVTSGPEWILVLDGRTGEEKHRLPWPSREGFENYNYYSRNYLYIAYLDGRHPHLIVQRGTYGLIKIEAYDGAMERVWNWEATGEYEAYRGQAAHTAVAADVDGDGRDEIVFGSAAIDDDGTGLWCRGEGHPDTIHVAHILPDSEDLQIFYGIEPRHERHAVCLVEAATGKMIWGCDESTIHVHGQGMAGDVIANEPGMELWTREADGRRCWFCTADGREIEGEFSDWPLALFAVYWDGGPTKALVNPATCRILRYPEDEYLDFSEEGVKPCILGVADLVGDWREEVLVSVPGEVRIYTTAIPATERRVTLLHDRMYRTGAARSGSGYPCQPQESGVLLEAGKARTGEDFWEGIL